jgi:hypothetical protein
MGHRAASVWVVPSSLLEDVPTFVEVNVVRPRRASSDARLRALHVDLSVTPA